jgi:hypothetical protein
MSSVDLYFLVRRILKNLSKQKHERIAAVFKDSLKADGKRYRKIQSAELKKISKSWLIPGRLAEAALGTFCG